MSALAGITVHVTEPAWLYWLRRAALLVAAVLVLVRPRLASRLLGWTVRLTVARCRYDVVITATVV